MPEIDDQHRRLFDMLNQLEAQRLRKEPAGKMMEIVKGLARYAQEHFSREENCIEKCACAVGSVNKLAHQRFIRLVENSLREFCSTPPPPAFFDGIHREMEDWIRNHICKIDVQLRKHASTV